MVGRQLGRCRRRFTLALVWGSLLGLVGGPSASGGIVTLRNGMQIEGRVGKISALGDNPLNPLPTAGEVQVTQIVLLDDDLRRTFVPSKQVAAVAESDMTRHERISIPQRVPRSGRRIGSVGTILRITPFDDWGRRIVTMNTPQGPLDIVQGITEITPTYTKVEGLLGKNPYIWDMRIATSSIPRETLSKILMRQIDPEDPDGRLRVVRLYIQSERFKDAATELENVLREFPELAALKKQIQELQQVRARRLLREIELRRDAGQHLLAFHMLNQFPPKGIASETLLKVRDMLREYERRQEQGKRVLELMESHVKQLTSEKLAKQIEPVRKEIATDLNLNTLDRMADYLRLADDEKMTADQKLSLAISGWLLGSGAGTENLAVSVALFDVRQLVREYLNTNRQHERDAIIEKLATLEGGTPQYLAPLIRHMTPAIATQADPLDDIPGLLELTTPGLTGEPDITYYVQLPPEYDPYRPYPCILTLNGSGTTPKQQIDWWAGGYSAEVNTRLGQATRRGYIVIAPQWSTEHQRDYKYSAREHAAVLHSLRDAVRRFSIDTDRVFLSGHSMGGDAAWDIALAHPDLWAGVIPIVATSGKYVARYWENGRGLPLYFVGGDMDGNRMSINGRDLDRYLTKAGYDAIVVEYQGRGHEHFQDEIQRLFEWMELHRRDFYPRQFECVSMRPWDNFFWWVELADFPERSMVAPLAWPEPKARPANIEARALENNRVTVRSAAARTTVWLNPELVDFDRRVVVSVNGRNAKDDIQPSAVVLLEDVRTRGDRMHPFWAKAEVQTGRAR